MLPPLHRSIAGTKGKQPVALLHPLAGSSAFWSEAAAALHSLGPLIAYDQRGFGRSPLPDRPWSLDDHAHDLEALRKELDIEHFTLAGVAVGGMIAVTYAALYPERVTSLVLSNPAVRIGRERLLARVAKAREGGMDAIATEAVEGAFTGLPRDERFERYLGLFRSNDARGYELTALGIQNATIESLLPALPMPVLVIAGALDSLVTPASAQATAAKIRDARFELVADAAHMVPFQAPATFAGHVRRFMDS